ncbi:helix-turn-helix domain-containing protein [Pseudofrankia asymbiotica]|uniref:AraC family transcriptional regulator n=1 Tax=Pseudofrankia asymbiotica TaxID=1834516 RepID=A0A1V2IF18_9ACTN|nr:helix-turn-helix domain-containing protein [Pseudofrankia asymbiotica]ONH31610.1 AraC family transcriptional regulator [Pseudofrankia asymbiotica]
MTLEFEHRGADSAFVDRVWRGRSGGAEETMVSAARTCWHLIVSRKDGKLLAGLRGPELRATTAPVPPGTEYLGVRFALGTVLRPNPAALIVDGYEPLPVTGSGRIIIGGEDWETPTYENVEQFVARLRDAGLLTRPRLGDEHREAREEAPTARTLQRRYRALTGLSRTAVRQIDRANAAATMLHAGRDWRAVAGDLGYFDQAHLGHALRRYIGRTASELRVGETPEPMSFLYKTASSPGS